jgi:Ca2+-transporting ATPase
VRHPEAQPLPEAPWAEPPERVLRALGTEPATGLSEREARQRLARYGPNRLRRVEHRRLWRILLDQFTSLIVALLASAAAAAFFFGEQLEGAAIVAVIFLNATIGFVTESRAVRSMEALRELGRTFATIRRDGRQRSIAANELVPGDLVVLDAGDVLSADVRLVSGSRLQADESALTGESLAVDKDIPPVAADAPLAERTSMLFKGTALTRGAGEAVVVATGMATELGRISALVEAAEPGTTPLEARLDRLAQRLIGLTLVIAVAVAIVVGLSGESLYFTIAIAVALAVATIPEGLPIVATVALARGMWRMAERNALVDQLAAVETLGSTSVLLTDKTGTLTENRMTVVELRLADASVQVGGTGLATRGDFRIDGQIIALDAHPELLDALRVGVLCSNATLEVDAQGQATSTGDPMEVALLVAGAKAGLTREALLAEWPETDEIAFDPETKRMMTFHGDPSKGLTAVKGAPEAVIEACAQVHQQGQTGPLDASGRRQWHAQAQHMAETGQRVLALATAGASRPDDLEESALTLLGLVGFFDPPRDTVRSALEACRAAGIRVVMATGDHGATAAIVARAVGLVDSAAGPSIPFVDGRTLRSPDTLTPTDEQLLLDAAIVARATPKQKLDLIELHQRHGAVVAMIGDGVNDAPALKKADIGIAMGMRGTQVAREASDMVLRDDDLGTIVEAVAQGRAIFENIRKFVVYLMSCNVSEILAVGAAALVGGPLPLLPMQILFLNLVTDVFPALALGVGEGSSRLMEEAPRARNAPFLTRRHWQSLFLLGSVIAASTLAALAVAVFALGMKEQQAVTVSFLTITLAQLWHVFSMRHPGSSALDNEILRNPWIWGAIALCLALVLMAVYWTPLAVILSLGHPGPSGWALALGASVIPVVVGQWWLPMRETR